MVSKLQGGATSQQQELPLSRMQHQQPNAFLLRVKDDPSFDLSRIAWALHVIEASPCTVHSITLCLDEYEPIDSMPSPDFFEFFKSIASIQSLVQLKIHDSAKEVALPISVITSLLQNIPLYQDRGLEHFELSGITLCGTSNELDEFGAAIQNLISLKHFVFTKCSDVVCTDMLQRRGVEALFDSIAALPNIQTIRGDMHWFLDGAARRAFRGTLAAVSGRANDNRLSLILEMEPGFDDDTLEALVWENDIVEMSLVEGSIHGTNPFQYLMLLAQVLELTMNRPRKVILDLEGMEQSSELHEFWVDLARLLAQSSSNTPVSPCASLAVEVYLPSTFQFQMDTIRAFAELLQNNFGLQISFLRETGHPCSGEYQKDAAMHGQIDTFLCLNQNQRGYLMQHLHEVSPEQWIQSFAAVNNDPRAVHYYLSKLPWMCESVRK